ICQSAPRRELFSIAFAASDAVTPHPLSGGAHFGRFRGSTRGLSSHEYRYPEARRAGHPQGPARIPRGRLSPRSRQGHRRRKRAHPVLRRHRDQNESRRQPRDLHRPQNFVRGRRRANIPDAFAADRQAAGADAKPRAARAPVLSARSVGQSGATRRRDLSAARVPDHTSVETAVLSTETCVMRTLPSRWAPSDTVKLRVSILPKNLARGPSTTRSHPTTSPRSSPITSSRGAQTLPSIIPSSPTTTNSTERTSPRKRPSILTGSWKISLPETLTLRPTATRVRSSAHATPASCGICIESIHYGAGNTWHDTACPPRPVSNFGSTLLQTSFA